MIIEVKTQFWAGGLAYDVSVCLNDNVVEVMTSGGEWRGKWDWNTGAGQFQPYLNLQLVAAVTDAINETEEIKAWRAAEPRFRALALHLACELSEVEPVGYSDTTFDTPDCTVLVLTDEEADEKAKERAKDTLWAFNASYLASYVPALQGERAQRAWGKVAQELCEEAGPLVEALLGDRLDEMLTDAVNTDGRGHFLNNWNGEEDEVKDPVTGERFYIYRE